MYVDNSNLLPVIILRFSVTLFLIFSIWRIFLHTIFRKYRVITGSNYKKVIIIGSSEATRELQDFFNRELGFGYKFMGYFSDNNESSKLGSIKQSYDYILENKIDDFYTALKWDKVTTETKTAKKREEMKKIHSTQHHIYHL